jgi:hypothetical protein
MNSKNRNIAILVNIAMKHQAKNCIKPECDLDAPCKRHARTSELAIRWYNIYCKKQNETHTRT